MSDDTTTTNDEGSSQERMLPRQVGAGLLRYVGNNPLAAIAGALIAGVLLARFAFLGNPKGD